MIFKEANAAKPAIDLFLGSAHTVHLYWESIGDELGLCTISTITALADSESGFCLTGLALAAFRGELERLYRHWQQAHLRDTLPSRHSEVMESLVAVLGDDSFKNATLMIC